MRVNEAASLVCSGGVGVACGKGVSNIMDGGGAMGATTRALQRTARYRPGATLRPTI